jgi:nucleoside-diphosphate-sugar epimerase
MKRLRAVVTGGAGFLGSHLCERFLEDDYEVVCLVDFCTGSPANVEHLLEEDCFRLVRADVTDYIHVSGCVDAVLHFALASTSESYGDPPAAPQQADARPVGPELPRDGDAGMAGSHDAAEKRSR